MKRMFYVSPNIVRKALLKLGYTEVRRGHFKKFRLFHFTFHNIHKDKVLVSAHVDFLRQPWLTYQVRHISVFNDTRLKSEFDRLTDMINEIKEGRT